MNQLPQPIFPPSLSESLARADLAAEAFDWSAPEGMPEPARSLLVHDRDMTSTLERHHGDAITLEVLVSGEAIGHYFREVILRTARAGTPVEFGLIEIELQSFPEDLRARILSGNEPLGGILNESGLPYRSSPIGYFSVARERLPTKLSVLGTDPRFFGRYNQLSTAEGACLARIIEILPSSPHP